MSLDLEALAGGLPIAGILAATLEAARRGNVVIEAPPGAGKTTIVPLALLEHGQLGDGQIIVLQPRRLAARMSATRTAALLGERVGRRVGYRVRFDHAGGSQTRLWFMTEGVLLRRLRDDPELAGVDAVVLDEFHERHLDGDLALALLRRLQLRGRPPDPNPAPDGPRPLRLLAMSATLDAEPVADFLDAARLRTEGRSFPVEIEHRSPRSRHAPVPLERRVASAVRELIERGLIGDPAAPGHALVFLPGAREIQACAQQCAPLAERAGLELLTLHGQLAREQQDRAVAPSSGSKLILSTNVAETSITIDGVVAVVDSGLARVADFDPGSGLPRLSLAPISRASAAQRAGRAGRTRPGLCIRLYARHDHDHRPEHQLPEIRRLDLAGPVLELAAAGVHAPEAFAWFEAPAPATLTVASELLRALGAIDGRGELREVGRAMLGFPLHPRLARLMIAGLELGVGELAATAAALLAERPLRRGRGAHTRAAPRTTDADILDEIELLGRPPDAGASSTRAAVERATKQLRDLVRRRGSLRAHAGPRPTRAKARDRALRQALLVAHPDRVAKVRVDEHDQRTLVFAFGGSAELSRESGVRASWVVALRSEERREGTRRRALVRSAAAIDPEWLVDLFTDAVTDTQALRFDPDRGRVVGESALRYGKLTIESSAMAKLPEAEAARVLLDAARSLGLGRACGEAQAEALTQLQLRARFVREHRPEFPILDDALIDAVLATACVGKTSFAELARANVPALLSAELGARAGDHRALDRLAPQRVTLPGGRRLTIHYEPDRAPWVGSRVQDFFGMARGPRILDGAVALVLHLHAPNRHDIAVTSDLAAFWREHYPDQRKRLSRRYPKHDWPLDPLTAEPPRPRSARRRSR
ncbi:ATP-dependent RNA helicase HrpB [Enhygromyxa salina]|uniref:ATP-dependent RNA helicase HrpB n=1 Tax=Enhygromyxa salina TaxID=215803 RepID=A0A2S9XRF9_9BACT|nr:ATP-dependent helicase HrpB [Enhygromyxa salina]PRP95452.1 ATP-dependent RNA helicase HrpB [Enhygromyxa salina]